MLGTNPKSSLITGIAFIRPVISEVIRYQRLSSWLKLNMYD